MSRSPFWDERYATEDYLFGKAPAAFVTRRMGLVPKGSRVLSLADGEGRNSVGFAEAGHKVTAMEAAAAGQAKARLLAEERGVSVDFVQAQIEDWDWAPGAFDAVAGIFIQFAPPPLRSAIHAGIGRTLRSGGLVLLHGYAPRQVKNGTGGPASPENLYTLDLLRADFPGWEVLVAEDYDATIAEGTAHVGISALVDFIARKP